MTSNVLRRAATAVTLSALTLAGAPLVTGPAAAATPPPAFKPTASTPIAGGSVMYGNDKITAAFDQPVTGSQNSMKVYERNADGSRGYQLPGSVATTSSSPVSSCGSTISWSPSGTLVNGEYEVVVNATGTKSSSDCTADTSRPATADYDYFVVGTVKPSGLSATNPVNNQTVKAAPFSGTLAPGLTVTVAVHYPNDPSGAGDASGSTVVPACGSSACPWTVKVDLSNLPDGSLNWDATATDSVQTTKSTSAVNGPAFTKDTSAPPAPSFPSGSPSLAARSVNLTVPQATDSAGDLASFLITVSDPDGHSVSRSVARSGQNMPAQTIDVSSLDDGTLTVAVQALDNAGNISGPCCTNGVSQSTPTVTKATQLVPNLSTSTASTPAGDVTFADAAQHAVQPPTSLDVEFTQPVELGYTDNTKPTSSSPNTTYSAWACLTSPEGNCIVPLTPKISGSGRGYALAIPKGALDPNGSYALAVTGYSKNLCPDINPGSTDSCQAAGNPGKFSDLIRVDTLNTGNALVFHLDSTPPTITFGSVTNPIDASNLQAASLTGTVDSDVSAVQLTMTSSNAPQRPRVQSVQTSTSNGTTTFSLNPLPLSGMVDGTLTIVAAAKDAAGNSSTSSVDVVLNALELTLVPGDGKLLVTWTKPTLVNNAAPNYTLSYRDQSTPNAPVQTVAPASTVTYAVLTGLTDGHSYGVTLSATDSVGDGPVAVGDAVPRGAPSLAFAAPSRLTYGTATTLKGRLTHAGSAISGAAITITPYYGSKASTPLHLTTTSTGAFSVRVSPRKTVTYVATFAGNSAYAPASVKRRVGLRVNIRITKATATRVLGKVAPNMHGRRVWIYERIGRHNHRIGSARLTSKSTWTFRHTWSRGTHYVFARFSTQNAYYGNNSPRVKIVR